MLAVMSIRNPLAHGQLVGRRRVLRRAVQGDSCGDVDQLSADGRGDGLLVLTAGGHADCSGQVKRHCASTSHPQLAMKLPDGRYAIGPLLRSAMTCSMMACRRWSTSAASIGSGGLQHRLRELLEQQPFSPAIRTSSTSAGASAVGSGFLLRVHGIKCRSHHGTFPAGPPGSACQSRNTVQETVPDRSDHHHW